jgi:hypothetical protein
MKRSTTPSATPRPSHHCPLDTLSDHLCSEIIDNGAADSSVPHYGLGLSTMRNTVPA